MVEGSNSAGNPALRMQKEGMPESEEHRPFPVWRFPLYSQKDDKVMHIKEPAGHCSTGSAEKTKRGW